MKVDAPLLLPILLWFGGGCSARDPDPRTDKTSGAVHVNGRELEVAVVDIRLEEKGKVRHQPTLALMDGQEATATIDGELFAVKATRRGLALLVEARYEKNGEGLWKPRLLCEADGASSFMMEDPPSGRRLTLEVRPVVAEKRK